MSIPPEIGSDEELGRSVFSHRHASRAQRSTVPHHVFLTKEGKTPAPGCQGETQRRRGGVLESAGSRA